MVTDVYIVYNDPSFVRKFGGTYTLKVVSPYFHFINEDSAKGRKEAFSLKGQWGARKTPFAICFDGDKALKAFYSEVDDDIVKSLINYINEVQD